MGKLTFITEKLKDVLSADDLVQIEETITTMVTESVDAKVADETKRIELLSEETIATKIEEGMAVKTEELISDYDSKLDAFEDEIVENLDKFLNQEISNKISDDLIRKVAINETYEPIVEGIKSLFGSQFIELDVEGAAVLKTKDDKITELEESEATLIADKMELNEEKSKLEKDLLIAQKSIDLTESERVRVLKFCESRSYSELKTGIDEIVKVVTETDSVIKDDKKVIEENIDQDDGIVTEKKGVSDKELETDVNESLTAQLDKLLED